MNKGTPTPTSNAGAGTKPNRRMRREDWLTLGLDRLAAAGSDALRLKDLCAAAGKTIGSFYHHFADQDAYFDAMMQHWRKINSNDVIAQIDAIEGADLQAERLDEEASGIDPNVELGVRTFARQNKAAAQIVREVDDARIGYLAVLAETRFRIPPELARDLAELEYAAFVGAQSIWGRAGFERGHRLSALYGRMVARYVATVNQATEPQAQISPLL